jgi:nicotinamide-nucleotide adenylyltransferase
MITPYLRDRLSSTEVRKRMLSGENWKTLVPPFVVEIIKRVEGVDRLRSVSF